MISTSPLQASRPSPLRPLGRAARLPASPALWRLALSSLLLFSLAACGPGPAPDGQDAEPEEGAEVSVADLPTPDLCVAEPHDQLCSQIPHDVTEILGLGYSSLGAKTQRPFDVFSWQSFVALNWPADSNGEPSSSPIGSDPSAPRVWQFYPTADDVFGLQPEGLAAVCPAGAGEGRPVFRLKAKTDHEDLSGTDILETTGYPLIDRDLNFVLFDVRVNPTEAEYIRSNGLNTKSGQKAFQQAGKTVSFPRGHYDDREGQTGGAVGAIEIKSSWRILDTTGDGAGEEAGRFFTTPALVFVAGEDSVSGEPFCFEATLGLVGFHVIQRTMGPYSQSMTGDGLQPFPQDWMWSTFEHVDNAPLATNAKAPTTLEPGPKVCEPPADAGDGYSFFNPACDVGTCPPNDPPQKIDGEDTYKWNTEPPYAARYATDGQYGTQVVRCRSVYEETADLNRYFQQALDGTVWAHYRLINTQWMGGKESPGENGNIPRFLANTTIETYNQADSSCLDCHKFARTTAGQDANFSFLLGLAQGSGEDAPGSAE